MSAPDPTRPASCTRRRQACHRCSTLLVPLAALGLPALFVGCAPGPDAQVEAAVAVLHPTAGNEVTGTVRFRRRASGGLGMEASLSGLSPGIHAFHVHRWGDCTSPEGTSAGPHYPFNPLAPDSEPDIVTGNLGELEAGARGTASRSAPLPDAELNGARAITGRAVVVHARGNDPSAAPTGDTGPRLACGVIGIAETAGEEES